MTLVEPRPRLWTADEYHRAAEAGVFAAGERLELIDGEILEMSPQNSPHATACNLCEEALREAFGPGHVVRGQKPLALGERSEPEPDVCVVAGRIRDFAAGHPRTALLVVEVADSSAQLDLIRKAALYARGGIPEYWVLLLSSRELVVHRDSDTGAGTYASISRLGAGESVSPLGAPGSVVSVAGLLP